MPKFRQLCVSSFIKTQQPLSLQRLRDNNVGHLQAKLTLEVCVVDTLKAFWRFCPVFQKATFLTYSFLSLIFSYKILRMIATGCIDMKCFFLRGGVQKLRRPNLALF